MTSMTSILGCRRVGCSKRYCFAAVATEFFLKALTAEKHGLHRSISPLTCASIPSRSSSISLDRATVYSFTAEPMALTENLFYLGAIPRVFPEQADQAQRQGEDGPDLTLDDTALAYRGREGVYVITGCSHSGIGNIVERAKQVTGMDRVLGVIGGFHLRQMDERSQGIIDYLEGEHIPNLYPCHCTALSVKVAMGNRMHIEEVGTGTGLEWV